MLMSKMVFEDMVIKFCSMNNIRTSREELYDLNKYSGYPIPVIQFFFMKKRWKHDFIPVPREGDISERLAYLMIIYAIRKFNIKEEKYTYILYIISKEMNIDMKNCMETIRRYKDWQPYEIHQLTKSYDYMLDNKKEEIVRSTAKLIRNSDKFEKCIMMLMLFWWGAFAFILFKNIFML